VVDANTTRLQLAKASLSFETLIREYSPHDTWPPVVGYDATSGSFKQWIGQWGHAPDAMPYPSESAGHDGAREYVLKGKNSKLAAGDTIVAPTRVGYTVTLSWTQNITLRDVVIHAAGNMAITEFQGSGGNRYDNVSLQPRGPTTPLSSNADGFHSSGMRHGPWLSRVRMHNLLDDFFSKPSIVNRSMHSRDSRALVYLHCANATRCCFAALPDVHNTFQIVAKRTGPNTVLVGDYQYLTGNNTVYATQRTLSRIQRGEFASFYHINKLARIISVRIAAIEEVYDMHLLNATHAAAAHRANATPCSACKAGLNSFASAQLWKISFADTLPAEVTALTFLNADNISNTGAVVEDSEFSGSISNLGRFKSSGGVLRRNTWYRGPTATPTNNNLEVRQRAVQLSVAATH
jgi:hypothetical protein